MTLSSCANRVNLYHVLRVEIMQTMFTELHFSSYTKKNPNYLYQHIRCGPVEEFLFIRCDEIRWYDIFIKYTIFYIDVLLQSVVKKRKISFRSEYNSIFDAFSF